MKKRNTIFLIGALAGLLVSGMALAVQPPDEVIELLSETASSPSKQRIDSVLGDAAVSELLLITNDTSKDSDTGLKLRAYTALRYFGQSDDSEMARIALGAAVQARRTASTGSELLLLRASMFSLAEVGRELSAPNLAPLLSHNSRDIRAAAAQALGITGSPTAIQPLRDQALVEPELQVQLAIADALFILDQD